MTKQEALQTIIDNQDNPALNYAINYAKVAIAMIEHPYPAREDIDVQIVYVLSNLSGWRQNKKFSITKETIKLVKETLKS